MKLGLISDTHNLLRPEVLATLSDSDAILHAGDINSQRILDQLKEIAPVYAVRGKRCGNYRHSWINLRRMIRIVL